MYQFACFTDVLDDGSAEVRRITDISWRKSERRGKNATYNARTHLFNSRASDNQEGYIVNATLHALIKKCESPHKNSITMLE
jgi:hypothetical protein